MEQAYTYIKRLLAFGVCLVLYYIVQPVLQDYFSIPLIVLAFSLIHARITGEKPPHLFAFYRTDDFFKKGGLRDLIRIFVTLFGFLYDTVIWLVWGVYLVFILFVDLLDFLKFIFFWIIHAILWFLRLYVPFIVLLYKLFIHYLIRWPWWLYQLAYFNIRYAFNKNSYRIALWGTLMATGIVFLFHYIEILLETIPGVFVIGYIIALLPLTWSFGEIANLRVQNTEKEDYAKVKLKFQNGIEAVRSILFYITLFVVLLLIQLGLNLLGWIPKSGIVIAGFMFNINNFINIVIGGIAILIVFGVIILPSYRLYTNFSELQFADSVKLLKTICYKVLQYIFISLPNAIFTPLVIVIPLVLMLIIGTITYNFKNGITDIKINQLKTEQASTNKSLEAYKLGKRIEHLEKLKQFPMYLNQEIEHRKILATEVSFAKEDLRSQSEESLRNIEQFKVKAGSIQNDIMLLENRNPNNPAIKNLQQEKTELQSDMKHYQKSIDIELSKMKIDIEYLEQRRKQIPFLFFMGGIWLVAFGSLVMAFLISYLGNVYHQLFVFRNDSTPSEWMNVIRDIRSVNSKQPLLGGTLLVLTVIVLMLLVNGQLQVGGALAQLFTLPF